jgi:hypothetical protein
MVRQNRVSNLQSFAAQRIKEVYIQHALISWKKLEVAFQSTFEAKRICILRLTLSEIALQNSLFLLHCKHRDETSLST